MEIVFFVGVHIVIVGALAFYWYSKKEARETIDEFERAFPGQCPICSYHNYGLMEGHVSGPVKPHPCPRNRGAPAVDPPGRSSDGSTN